MSSTPLNKTEQTKPEETVSQKTINRRTFISYLVFLVSGLGAYLGWKGLYHSPLEQKGVTAGVRQPLRNVLNTNEKVFRQALSPGHMATTYPKAQAVKNAKVNGEEGLAGDDISTWSLQVVKNANETLKLTMDDIKALPKTEIVYSFKCIEGWDMITHWSGVKFSDFIKHYQLDTQSQQEYLGLHTPDNQYYVGIDMASALHPQTLLCYELSGKLLSLEHGAPLRLIIPVKYGIKNLKRIGTMYFSNQRPPDYWAERGYDYFSGL